MIIGDFNISWLMVGYKILFWSAALSASTVECFPNVVPLN